jgi:predicted CoA-binding protein
LICVQLGQLQFQKLSSGRDSLATLPPSKLTIAVVGASSNRSKFGNKCVRAYAAQGYDVYPVHPRERTIEGHPVFAKLTDLPLAQLDRVSIYLPPDVCIALLLELAQKAAREVWFNPGADRANVIAAAKALGMNVVVGCSIVDIGVSPHSL